jgi:hypothetical protein
MQQNLIMRYAILNQIIQETGVDGTFIERLHSNHRGSGI